MNCDVDATRQTCAPVLMGGVAAAAKGQTDVFVSGGAAHRKPDGGGPVAIIARVKT